MSIAAIVLASLAAALAPPALPVRWRSQTVQADPTRHGGRRLLLTAAVSVTALLVLARGSLLVLGLIGAGSAVAVGRLVIAARQRSSAVRREEHVLETCEVLVGELHSGQPPVFALGRCVEVWPEFAPVETAARLGADVPGALRALAAYPGARGLGHVAGAWQVAQGSGAGLANALAQVAGSAREAQSTRRLVSAELASAQATARLVAGLPLVALAMGSGIGGNPWHFLLATPAGLACLACGLALAFVGLFWIERISASVMAR